MIIGSCTINFITSSIWNPASILNACQEALYLFPYKYTAKLIEVRACDYLAELCPSQCLLPSRVAEQGP